MALCLLKSQHGLSTAEHTEGRGKTSLTTTKIQGGCTTIYNLPSLLCDSRGGWREGERGCEESEESENQTHRQRVACEFQSRGKDHCLGFFPWLGPSVISELVKEAIELKTSHAYSLKREVACSSVLFCLFFCLLFCQFSATLSYLSWEMGVIIYRCKALKESA